MSLKCKTNEYLNNVSIFCYRHFKSFVRAFNPLQYVIIDLDVDVTSAKTEE